MAADQDRCFFETLYAVYFMVLLFSCKGLVTLDEMKAKREDLVREHEKQLAAKLKSDEAEGLGEIVVNHSYRRSLQKAYFFVFTYYV